MTTIFGKEANWNFIQPSTVICVERAFSILKGRWTLIIKCLKVHLKNMLDIVEIFIILHNLCLINNEVIEEI